MKCMYGGGGGEIEFPPSFTVQRVENSTSSYRVTSVPILQLSSSLFENALSPFGLDRESLPTEAYLAIKGEKQGVSTLSALHS